MSTNRDVTADVVVVGGGIGGLSSAYALAAAGYHVRLLEQAPQFGEVGAGLQLAPNATRILQQWGVLDEIIAKGVLPQRMVLLDALDGSELTHLDLHHGFVERYGAPYVVMHRGDLHDILLRACQRAGVDLRTNAHVESIDTTRTSATATVGSEVHRGDVVIAADGLNSSLRQRFSDDQPVPSGYAAYRGAIPVDNLSSVEGLFMNDVIAYIGPGCHFVQYALRGGEMFNQVAVFRSPAFLRGEENWGGPEELEAAFERCTPQIRRAMTHLWTDRFWPMYDREPISNWVDGRLALSGDAAHPMLQYLAQGACQAIEDAANLAWHATTGRAGRGDDWGVALAAYQADRTVRTARVQTTARTWGDIWHSDGLTRTLRNAMFRDRPIDDYRYVDWLYGLPAYPGSPVAQQQAAVPVHSGS